MADRWRGRNLPSGGRSFLPWSWRVCRSKDARAFSVRESDGSWQSPSMQRVERMGEQAHQSDQDQIDGDQVVQQAGQDQDQNSEQQRHQGLPSDNIDMHEKPLSNVPPNRQGNAEPPDPVASQARTR